MTHCFKEVVAAFRKLLFEEKNCELPFPKIGKLQIKNKVVKMKYYQEFLERQNQHFKNRIIEDKNKNQAINYNPNWDVDQYESRVSYYELCANKNSFKSYNVGNVYFINNTFGILKFLCFQ